MCLPLHHSALFKTLRPPRDDRRLCFTLETCLSNNLNYNLMSKKTSKCRKPSHDETKVFKNIMNVLLTLTYSVFLDKPVNVALAVEHRCADLEERDTSA